MTVRLLTYNVRYFGHALKGLASTAASKRNIAQALATLDDLPDLIALQEVETQSVRAGFAHRGGQANETQLDAFLRHLSAALKHRGVKMPYQSWYFPAHVYRLGRIRLYTTGLAMLVNSSRLHVIGDNQDSPHSITHHRSERLRRVKQTRIAAHLALETDASKRFHVFNTHLSLPTPWAKEFWSQRKKMGHGANQLAEAKAVSGYASQIAGAEPYLVVGDFNSAPATPVYEYLTKEAKLQGAQQVLAQIDARQPDSFSTAGFMALRMHLDHVFGGGKIEFVDLDGTYPFADERSAFAGLSDHVPLITRFEVG